MSYARKEKELREKIDAAIRAHDAQERIDLLRQAADGYHWAAEEYKTRVRRNEEYEKAQAALHAEREGHVKSLAEITKLRRELQDANEAREQQCEAICRLQLERRTAEEGWNRANAEKAQAFQQVDAQAVTIRNQAAEIRELQKPVDALCTKNEEIRKDRDEAARKYQQAAEAARYWQDRHTRLQDHVRAVRKQLQLVQTDTGMAVEDYCAEVLNKIRKERDEAFDNLSKVNCAEHLNGAAWASLQSRYDRAVEDLAALRLRFTQLEEELKWAERDREFWYKRAEDAQSEQVKVREELVKSGLPQRLCLIQYAQDVINHFMKEIADRDSQIKHWIKDDPDGSPLHQFTRAVAEWAGCPQEPSYAKMHEAFALKAQCVPTGPYFDELIRYLTTWLGESEGCTWQRLLTVLQGRVSYLKALDEGHRKEIMRLQRRLGGASSVGAASHYIELAEENLKGAKRSLGR